ncbi:MAG: class I SAM-dependent RNA methyltransferase [Cytophagales bacterium]
MKIVITTFKYLVPFLLKEIEALGHKALSSSINTVTLEGTEEDVMILNYKLRTANQVLLQIAQFTAKSPKELTEKLKQIIWDDFLWEKEYFSVVSTGFNENINNFMYVNQLCKDSIVDFFKSKYGIRPDSGPEKNKAVIALHWDNEEVSLYIDTSGETLARHGYRKYPWRAPLQENLACGILMASEWTPEKPLLNPMCGSGTLAIEAALMAMGRYPGSLRSNYSFLHTKPFSPDHWNKLRKELRAENIGKTTKPEIIASDIHPEAIKAAQSNAQTAGVDYLVRFETCDFEKTHQPSKAGVLIVNPEYGERMGEEDELKPIYKALGDYFKQECKGYKTHVFTGNSSLAKHIGLRTSSKTPFMNGKIECRLLSYDIF